jgi:hypothetical protein
VDGNLTTDFQGEAEEYTANHSMLPATVYTFRVLAANSLGPSNWSAQVNFSTDEAGFCGNPDDVAAYKATKTTMKGDIQRCLIGCAIGGSHTCVVDCIHKQVGLSLPCAMCWFNEGTCTIKKCIRPCTLPKSQACADCSEKECFPECVTCSGIAKEFFPP